MTNHEMAESGRIWPKGSDRMTTDQRIRIMRAHQRKREAAAHTNYCAALVESAVIRYLEMPTVGNAQIVQDQVERAKAAQLDESRALSALDEVRTLAGLGLSEWPEEVTE